MLTVPEAGTMGAPDLEHLERAARERWVIFTQDDDFLRLAASHPHAGVVYARQQTPIGEVIRGLMLIHQVLSAEEMSGHIEYL